MAVSKNSQNYAIVSNPFIGPSLASDTQIPLTILKLLQYFATCCAGCHISYLNSKIEYIPISFSGETENTRTGKYPTIRRYQQNGNSSQPTRRSDQQVGGNFDDQCPEVQTGSPGN